MIELYFDNGALPLEVYLAIDNTCDTAQSDGFGGRVALSVSFEPCPPPKVCCLPNGECLLVDIDDECYQAGGEIYPEYFSCDPNPCPPPPLVCCLPDGFCLIVEMEEECFEIGGVIYSEYNSCEPNPCPLSMVCCLPDGTCLIIGMEEECNQMGGVIFPEFSCDPNPCASSAVDELAPAVETLLLSTEPNPFSETTLIRYNLAEAGRLQIELYDPSGRLVRQLHSGTAAAGSGSVQWDGFNDAGQRVSPGAYFIRMQTDERTLSRRLVRLQ